MESKLRLRRPAFFASAALALTLAFAAPVAPANAQDNVAELRLRKLEAEVRALQRQVFPGGDGKYFTPQVEPSQVQAQPAGTPASGAVTDLLARMEALEAQIARLTAQNEENAHRLAELEAKVTAMTPPPSPPPATEPVAAPVEQPTTSANLAAMTGGASVAKPEVKPEPKPETKPVVTAAPAAKPPVKPAPAAAKPAAPSPQRLAAVQAIAKPKTDDPGDDEYSYGFRLWEAKFYPEAEQQLKLFVDKYPGHARISFGRNLLGRAYLDEGNAREAASWFLQNYQADKKGARAADSLLFLAEAMRQLKDTNRACIALAEFADTYPADAVGRLKAQYDQTRAGVKCN